MMRLLLPLIDALLTESHRGSHGNGRTLTPPARAFVILVLVLIGWWYLASIEGKLVSLGGRLDGNCARLDRIENILMHKPEAVPAETRAPRVSPPWLVGSLEAGEQGR